jgi:chromosome segregation ATPase
MSDNRSVHANILAGPDVQVLEMSRRELQLEADVRLTPGAGICLNVTIGGANYLAGGRVTRVDATLSGGQVRYRAGILLDNDMPAFERPAPTNTRTEASPAPPPGAAEEEPMDAAQEQQILKTALRSAEAHRKELAEELHLLQAERATWDEQRKALEQRVAAAEHKVDQAARQINAGKDAGKHAEQALLAKHASEHAAWQAELKALKDAAAKAEIAAKQADAKLKDSDARVKDADARQKQADAKVAELDARVKSADARMAELDARVKAADAKAAAADARTTATEARVTAAESKTASAEGKVKETQARVDQLGRELAAAGERERSATASHAQAQDAWKTERASLQERGKAAEAQVARLASELAVAQESEQRLLKKVKDEEAKLLDLVQENERQIEEIEAVRQALSESEQAAARYDQEKQSWTAQKERLTSRLQLTEKWCGDQQNLLHALRQHLEGASTLLDGWKPAAVDGLADTDTKNTRNGRKATA